MTEPEVVVPPAPEKWPRLRALWRRVRDWLLCTGRMFLPEQRARRAAGYGAVLAAVLLFGFLGSRIRSGVGLAADALFGAAVALLLAGLAALAVRLAAWLLRTLPRWLGYMGSGALVAFTLFTLMGLPWFTGLLAGMGIVAVQAFLFGAVAVVTSRDFNQAHRAKKIIIVTVLLLTLAANGALGYWLAAAGKEADALPAAPKSEEVAAIAAPDPSQPGPYRVLKLTYGSGTNRQRPEFASAATLRTSTMDATPFVRGFSGWRRKLRKWYWGFDANAFPLNGTVWYPEDDGPFPLVLIVHGNHHMGEFSDPGYAYLGELFASRGYFCVSVDENFLNGSLVGGVPRENDARGWFLLQHLQQWREWNAAEGNPFRGKVDLDRIALIGHSRGGEAVGHAGAFNRLSHYPDEAGVKFDFHFSIRAIIAIAPVDGQYEPADQPTPLEDVSYFTLQGSHDSDVAAFHGDRQYNRVRFTRPGDAFKASVYIWRANHGQFNTVWGRTDAPPPWSWLLNLRPLLAGEEQRRIGKVFMSAFLEATLRGDARYRALFRDARAGRAWLPETAYITRYEDPTFRLVAGYEEDVDVTTTTLPGGTVRGENFTIWREQDFRFRYGSVRRNHAVYLGWRPPQESAEEKETSEAPPAAYTLTLPEGLARNWRLGPESLLVFHLAEADEKPDPPKDETVKKKEEAARREKKKEKGKKEEKKKDEEKKEALDLTVELVFADGRALAHPLSRFRPLPPTLPAKFTKLAGIDRERYRNKVEPVLQTFELPLGAFAAAGARFDAAALRAIRFRFDRSPKGVVILDHVGFAGPPAR